MLPMLRNRFATPTLFESKGTRSVERRYGRFERTLTLPQSPDPETRGASGTAGARAPAVLIQVIPDTSHLNRRNGLSVRGARHRTHRVLTTRRVTVRASVTRDRRARCGR